MDLADRIARRRNREMGDRLVVDRDALDPTVHLPEPIGRKALFEDLLDAIEPVFEEARPPNVYLWGPAGAGKSAIVSGLMAALRSELNGTQPLFTATRGASESADFRFAYLDTRFATTPFKLYRGLLDAIRVEPVPERGVGTADLRERLQADLTNCTGVLVAVDHLGEPDTPTLEDLDRYLDPFESLSWIGVGRAPPERLPMPVPATRVHVPAYSYELVDILTVRGSRGLSRNITHDHARELSQWAGGNAHDALAALFIAAVTAEAEDEPRIDHDAIVRGMEAVPENGVPIGRVLARSATERQVLRRLLDRPFDRDVAIPTEADAIAADSDLTSGTVERLLYELAQVGVLERTELSVGGQLVGRQPSSVVPNFSPALFEQLDR